MSQTIRVNIIYFRQDVDLLGDSLSVGVIGTVFLAALLGALVAPALTAGMTRMMDFEIDVPEIELPEFPIRRVEEVEDEDAEVVEVRSMKHEIPWMKMAETAYNMLRSEFTRRNNGGKFGKYKSSSRL